MTKRKDYIDARLKELQKEKAKDNTTTYQSVRKNESNEDAQLASAFYKALASRDGTQRDEVNAQVSKQYESKGQVIGTPGAGTAGGILVPTTVADSIITQMLYVSPIRQISKVISNMPAQLQLPSEASVVQAYWVAEAGAITASQEVFAPNVLTPYEVAGLDTFSNQVLQDAAVVPDLQTWVEQRFALALALQENQAFTNGTGSGQPYGFRSSYITPTAVAQAGATVSYSDVTKLMFALGTAYRSNAVFVTSSAGALALTNLRDTQGRPIWRDGLANGNPPTLLGRPVYIVDEIPSNLGAGTNATELWFGTFGQNYIIGDRQGLSIDYGTNANDFATNQISLRVVKRVAGMPILSQAFAKLSGVIAS
ncbi:phage major capsid protein [Williamsia sterculiae]|uniref:Phage major capsid protein, HK97 family n=1 Tax=Williamsia sterculiae TaxID=1344003 RepID=A0A1N7GFQ6_9NOCA|nr:phage major capsid protein [Williamsia sterculiae]SIS11437.1 phage major capsid protein, HK97 family [Williamsia sterculiae]